MEYFFFGVDSQKHTLRLLLLLLLGPEVVLRTSDYCFTVSVDSATFNPRSTSEIPGVEKVTLSIEVSF